jgi:hypothetical protein
MPLKREKVKVKQAEILKRLQDQYEEPVAIVCMACSTGYQMRMQVSTEASDDK